MSLGIAVSDIVSQSDDSILATHATWERIELGKIATIQNGFPFKSELFSPTPDGMPLIRIRDVGENASDTFYRGEYPNEFVVNAGDLLVGMDGDFKSAIWNGPASLLNQRVCRIQLNNGLYDFKFLYFVLPGYLKAIHKVTSAVTVKHLSSRSISEIPLPLPPLPEQRRIVAKLEELLSKLDAGVAAVRRTQSLLKRYRQSVLHAAVTGELTRAWREAHPTAPTETGATLLQRIRAERRAQWEAAQVAKRGGQLPLGEGWKAKYAEPEAVDTSKLPELPTGWTWASMRQLGEVRLGRQRAPQHHSGPHMRPYLRVANVYEDRFDLRDVMEMNFTPEEYETYALRENDILLNEGQSLELVGRPALYRNEVPGACFTNTLVRFRVYQNVLPVYALSVFRSYLHNGEFQKIASWTTSIAHLGADRFAGLHFPLPPLPEQAEIVAEVERRLTVLDALSKTLTSELKRAERLRQSILHQAFTGRLVPQDATDEPAAALLARLRELGAAPAKAKAGRGRKNTDLSQIGLSFIEVPLQTPYQKSGKMENNEIPESLKELINAKADQWKKNEEQEKNTIRLNSIERKELVDVINNILLYNGINDRINEDHVAFFESYIGNVSIIQGSDRIKNNGLTEIIFNHYFKPPPSEQIYFHFTSFEAFKNIISSQTLRLHNLNKRFSDDEFVIFYREHGMDGYDTGGVTLGVDHSNSGIMAGIYYLSLTLLSTQELWDTFAQSGSGVRLGFKIHTSHPDFRSVYYSKNENRDKITLISDLETKIQSRWNMPFVFKNVSKIGAFYIKGIFSNEGEHRFLIKTNSDDYQAYQLESTSILLNSVDKVKYIEIPFKSQYADFILDTVQPGYSCSDENIKLINQFIKSYSPHTRILPKAQEQFEY